jgi:hypothetical protein
MGSPGTPPYFPVYVAKSAFGVLVQGSNFRILNGIIRQGAGKDASQANAIGFNPFYVGAEPVEIAGIMLDYSGDQMTGICTHFVEVCNIHHNVVCDRGTVITDRHQGCNGIGRLGGLAKGVVHHNLLLRVRHRGVAGKEVYHNEIYGDSFDTNSFGISVMPGGKYYGNRLFGTGYHFVGFNWATGITVCNNFIHIQGDKPNSRSPEYGDQNSGDGIRLTQYGGSNKLYENLLYHHNVIVVNGKLGGHERGIQFFSDPYVKNLVFRNNIVKAIVQDNETKQVACVVAQGNADRANQMLPILYEDNTFISNVLNVRFGDYYGVGSNHRFVRCKFVRIGDKPRYRTFYYETGYPCKNHVLLDCTFEGGASLDSVGWADKKAEDDFTVQWTLSIHTSPGATVLIADRRGAEVFTGWANGTGQIDVPLAQYIQKPGGRTYLTPHRVTVTTEGKTATKMILMDKRQTVLFRKRPI